MYSTCTINTVENEENIIKLMEQYGDYLEIEEIQDTHNNLNNGIMIQTGDQIKS
jgi:16S rRNA C967 or C1407 C5-methylase (RsmB/RsmF family)